MNKRKFDLQLFSYDDMITRSNVGSLVPPEVSAEIIKALPKSSAALALMHKLPNMSTSDLSIPVQSALPQAYFQDGETGLMQTSNLEWTDKHIYAEKLNVIVPISNSLLADIKYNIWDEAKPSMIEAIGKAIDAAVFFGAGKPALWPTGIVPAAIAMGNYIASGTFADVADDIGAIGGVMNKVESCGYRVNGFAACLDIEATLRSLRNANGDLLFQPSLQVDTPASLYGRPLTYPDNGAWNASTALLVAGDFKAAKYAMRQDIMWKFFDQANLQDNTGKTVYNLAQQDMIAIVATMRLGWQVPNPMNRIQATEASRYPFAVLTPAS